MRYVFFFPRAILYILFNNVKYHSFIKFAMLENFFAGRAIPSVDSRQMQIEKNISYLF